MVPVSWVRDLLEEVQAEPAVELERDRTSELSWSQKLWTVPSETRLGVADVAEALARPKSFVYARTQASTEHPIPHRKLDGALNFTAGDVRAWIQEREVVMVAGAGSPTLRV